MAENPTFIDFYNGLGMMEYPFAQWSAEQEKRGKELFIRPTYYGPIEEKFRSGAGMLLVGERGTGKTAALYDLMRSASVSDLIVQVSDFASISAAYNPCELYRLIASKVTEAYMKDIVRFPHKINRLTPSQRLFLSYVYSEFTTPTTKGELRQTLERLQASFWKRLAYRLYGAFRYPLNFASTFASNFISDLILRSAGMSASVVNQAEVREFFPDLPFRVDDSFNSLPASLNLITNLGDLSRDLGYSKVTILIDKLDEDDRLEGDAEKIAEFVRGVVTQTNLHLSDKIQIVASIWSVPFAMLQKTDNVRTQKMNVETLSWDELSLERALNNRLRVFSDGKITNYRNLFSEDASENTFELIFYLSNKNPRDLWHAFDFILKEQYRVDPNAKFLTLGATEVGLKNFVGGFNYFEYYPRKADARANSMDVYAYIRHLLRLSSVEFTRNQLTERSGVSGGSANNYVRDMQNIGLISSKGQTGGNVNYVIRDPKIRYALEKGIDITIA